MTILDLDAFEIVHVIDERTLIDAESYQRHYRGRQALERGYYVVRWDGIPALHGYDETAHFVGPFPDEPAAAAAAAKLHCGGSADVAPVARDDTAAAHHHAP